MTCCYDIDGAAVVLMECLAAPVSNLIRDDARRGVRVRVMQVAAAAPGQR